MAKSVTLKDTDGTNIYPVTDIALVNNGIHADPIAATTDAAYITTGMIQDGAVTSDKIDWTTMVVAQNIGSATTSASGNIVTNRNVSDYVPIAATCDHNNAVPSFYNAGLAGWLLHLSQVAGGPLANTAVTGVKVYYLKLS